jgi:hypothetical protein
MMNSILVGKLMSFQKVLNLTFVFPLLVKLILSLLAIGHATYHGEVCKVFGWKEHATSLSDRQRGR